MFRTSDAEYFFQNDLKKNNFINLVVNQCLYKYLENAKTDIISLPKLH